MPNWIEGSLKLRGTSENLKRFFEEGLEGIVDVDVKKNCCEVLIAGEPWVKDSRRAFVTDEYAYWETSDGQHVVVLTFRQAWCIDDADWVQVSENFDLDVRLFGFECGMRFTQELEVIKGKITIDETMKYEDWDWECPMPKMGG